MNPVEIILKKRNGYVLSSEEINFFINSYLNGEIPEYQMSALLMAIYFQGLLESEIVTLTECYINSGKRIEFPAELVTADKHSTGGVGDKISLMLAPIAAALGLYIPMISGRGLGHTGGTLDKLESIPGFCTQYSMSDLKNLVTSHGLAMVGQSEELVPADKRIYALRDVTATVESIGLITASIMSKKIAEGAKHLVIDLKVGRGAFMPTLKHARELAVSLIKTGKAFEQKVSVVFTNMNSPLGTHIGNALEVVEAIEYLKGKFLPDTQIITEKLICEMVRISGLIKNEQEALKQIRKVVSSGLALKKFQEMILAQGGNPSICDKDDWYSKPKYILPIISELSGYVSSIDTQGIGYALVDIHAGRKKVTDTIDIAAGAILYPKVGVKVLKGELIGYLHCNHQNEGELAIQKIKHCFHITTEPQMPEEIILDKLTDTDLTI